MGQSTEAAALVSSTRDAAFAVDEGTTIVACNPAAADLLGQEASRLLGRQCHDVLSGRDVFGNRFCAESCPVSSMARRREPIRHLELDIRAAGGKALRVSLLALFAPERNGDGFTILHVLQPVTQEAQDPRPALEGDQEPFSPGADPPPPRARKALLTRRESEILGLLEQGSETVDIADSLFISPKTVRNHVQNILGKLGAHSRLEAVAIARRRGDL